jgi:hypothetical protein
LVYNLVAEKPFSYAAIGNRTTRPARFMWLVL